MSMNRRKFNAGLVATGVSTALSPFGIVRAQSSSLKVGVLLNLKRAMLEWERIVLSDHSR